mmetsp:Transcript_18223/g.34693  ORF Transcript_18223/g.34693 Transcript_18223/m.34693 type:complete len:277 (-) Transcript_18223:490-1320(-)
MAEHLASIFGTEKDRVNCPFFFKIGACRHGDRCSRLHTKPTISQTVLLVNIYQSPELTVANDPAAAAKLDPRKVQEHFEDFYEDIFEEMSKYGEIENLNVCDNTSDHMVGNAYVKFREEEEAVQALAALGGRFYGGRPIVAEFSPVTDFREATCRQYEENICTRGGLCNFMHLKPISRDLRRRLFGRYKRRSRSRSRSRDRSDRKDRDRSDRDRGRDRDRDSGKERKRETSAERRAKIAAWNKEKKEETTPAEAEPEAPPSGEGDGGSAGGQPSEY